MASKSLGFLVAAFLLASAGFGYSDEKLKEKAYGKISAPEGASAKAPNPAPPLVKYPTPTPPQVVKQPTPVPPLAKPPTTTPPVIKPPVTLPPVVKQPTPVPPIHPPTTPLPPPTTPPVPPVRTYADCTPLCAGRCKLHSRPNVCNRACNACCFRCKCVPPGTYGNRELCGKCYTDMTTHRNKPKCP